MHTAVHYSQKATCLLNGVFGLMGLHFVPQNEHHSFLLLHRGRSTRLQLGCARQVGREGICDLWAVIWGLPAVHTAAFLRLCRRLDPAT